MFEFRRKPCHDKRLKATNWKFKNLMMGIAINHLLLWESGLVSLKPLEVGELHCRAQAAEGGRPVTFSRIPNQIPPSVTSLFRLQLSRCSPLHRVPHLSHETVTSYQMGALSSNGGPPCPHSEKAPEAPFPFFDPLPGNPFRPLNPLYAAGCWT